MYAYIYIVSTCSVHMSQQQHISTQKKIRVLENRLDNVSQLAYHWLMATESTEFAQVYGYEGTLSVV